MILGMIAVINKNGYWGILLVLDPMELVILNHYVDILQCKPIELLTITSILNMISNPYWQY